METLKSSNRYYRVKQRYKSQPFDTNHKISSPRRSLDYIYRKGHKKQVQPEHKIEAIEPDVQKHNDILEINNILYYGIHSGAYIIRRITQWFLLCSTLGIQMIHTLSLGTYIPLLLYIFNTMQSYFEWIIQSIDSIDQKYTLAKSNKVQNITYDRKLTPEEALAHACDLWATFHTNRGSKNANVLSFQSYINTKLAMHDNSVVLLTNSNSDNTVTPQNPIAMSKLKYIFKLVISAHCIMISLIMMILKGSLSYTPKTGEIVKEDEPTSNENIYNYIWHQYKALKMLLRDLFKAICTRIFGIRRQATIEPCIETLITSPVY